MKAVVMEIKDGYAALLQDDGSFVKLKDNNFKIGDVVNMKKNTMRRKGRFSAMVAAAAVLVMLVGAGVWVTPSYSVSVDVNPSVEMDVNLFDRVINVHFNDDAAAVFEGVNLKNKDIKDAISVAVASIGNAGYFDEGGNMLIAAAAKNRGKAEQLAESLGETARAEAEEKGFKPEVATGAMGVEMVEKARGHEITPGKYNIIVNLLGIEEDDDEVDFDVYVGTPVRELMQEFTEGKGAAGRARAADAAANAQANKEDGEPAANADLKEGNAAGKAEQADNKDGNADVTTPAADKKAPEADDMQDNVTDKKPDDLPEVPAVPVVPQGGRQ